MRPPLSQLATEPERQEISVQGSLGQTVEQYR
jgi:hypothetical protein